MSRGFRVLSVVAGFAAVAGVAPLGAQVLIDPGAHATITVDSSKHTVLVAAGPFHVPVTHLMQGMSADQEMAMQMEMPNTLAARFPWPLTGWLRGFRFDLLDQNGDTLPSDLMHHIIMVNFSRRQLVYGTVERLLGAAREQKQEQMLPRTIGVPMPKGQDLALYVMWDNESDQDRPAVYVHLTMYWMPTNMQPPPVSVLPMYLDSHMVDTTQIDMFQVPPGHHTQTFSFSFPVSGHILGVGGHLHDFGTAVELVDGETGKVLTHVDATRDSTGHVKDVARRIFAIQGEGIRVVANHPYRVVAVYDNTSRDTLPAVMGHMVGIFAPDDMKQWPKINPKAVDYVVDMQQLADTVPRRSGTH
ncbi:MAG TPA: hypothetical protein VFK78_05760 [Gemmatimonadales bacterium]|nr:hypothetical protein [Gemmatimonadales bacterium]